MFVNMSKKNIISFLFLAIITVLISGCTNSDQIQKTTVVQHEQDQLEDNQNLNSVTQDAQQLEVGPEILETDIDIRDWTEYRSDEFDYSFKLPSNYVFLPEGGRSVLEYDPQNTSFEIGLAKDNEWEYLFHFSIINENVDSFIKKRDNEIGRTNSIEKLFSKNGIDYYVNSEIKEPFFTNIIIYNYSLGIQFSCSKADCNQELFWTIVGSMSL